MRGNKVWGLLKVWGALLVLTGIVGCSNSGDGNKEEAAAQEVTLKFVWWGKEQRKEDTQKVVDLYMKEHPGVKIETEDFSGTDALSSRLAMDTADQKAADIIQGDYGFIFNYINRDLIEPLGPYIKNKSLSISDVPPEYLAPGMKNDELYAVNIGINSEALIYDPAFLQEAGIKVPSQDYTIDDLYKTLVELKETIDDPDFYPMGNMFAVSYFLRTRGVSMYNAEGTALGYDDDKDLADYFTLYKKWTEEGLIGSFKGVSNDENHPVITGKTAFFSVSSNASTILSSKAGRTIKLLPLPKAGDKEGRFIKPSMFLAVSSYSKYPEEAAKFIDFFINNAAANDILKGERGVPVSAVIAAQLSGKLGEGGKEQYELLDYLKTHSSPIDPPAPSSALIADNAYKIILERVLDGSITPEQAAKNYRTEATSILDTTDKGAAK
ncbi:ABC transporter substrate-binding protein [Paenibacillus sp. FSL L8-0436]|uniref:ABC transporter substrate-binding protein n=1 Tax=Paenibacillus sp. FSL L8-0436 TaxID=2954686 RepID=UPI003157FC3F